MPLGTAGIVASVVPVNDRAAVPLMLELHARCRPVHARRRRCWPRGRPRATTRAAATAHSFLALGGTER